MMFKALKKKEYAFLWGYKSIVGLRKVLMDFNEIKVACVLFVYDDSKVECIIPSKAETALCIIFCTGSINACSFYSIYWTVQWWFSKAVQ